MPDGGSLVANQITGVQQAPITGDEADAMALRLLRDKRVSDAADSELAARIITARKTVQYQPGYHAPAWTEGTPSN